MKEDSERITVWITTYALTKGIIKTTARYCGEGMIAYRVCGDATFDSYAHRNDWHHARTSAIARAEEMRKSKIASLKRQIASLEKRAFIVTGDDPCQDPLAPASE